MNSKLSPLFAAGAFALTALSAQAATVTPVSYVFDQPQSCGTYCYLDPNNIKLTDGIVGFEGWAVGGGTQWDGWLAKPVVNIDFNFGSAKAVSTVAFGTTQDSLGDVALPSLNVFSSNDGVTWVLKGSLVVPPSSANDRNVNSGLPHGFLTLSGLGINDQYVRVQALQNGPWTFADEVIFTNGSNGGIPEASTWMMMLSGFGLTGFALRKLAAGNRRLTALRPTA